MKPVEIEFILRNRTQEGFNQITTDSSTLEGDVKRLQVVIDELQRQLQELSSQRVTPDMDQSANIAMMEALKNKLEELQAEMANTKAVTSDATEAVNNTKVIPPDLPRAKSSFNGLNMSIQQIAREMPALAMGPQMFFLAISNNLPIFTDELAKARKEYDTLVASGQKGTPVWKQVVSSLFSWQTAMTTGIMLLVMYGKEIVAWTADAFGAKSALDEMRESMKATYEVEKEAHQTATKTRFELLSTMKAIKNFNGTKDEERRKIDELNTKYGESFGFYQTLSDWYDTLSLKAEQYTRVLFLQAKQQSLLSKAVEADDKVKEIESKPEEDYQTWFGSGGKVDGWVTDRKSTFIPNGATKKREALREATAEREQYFKEIETLKEDEENILKSANLNAIVAGSIQDFENTIKAKRAALARTASPEEYQAIVKEIESYEKKIKAITGDKDKNKVDKDIDKNIKILSDKELEARQKVEDNVVVLMKEGYERQRAEALSNFNKEQNRIENEEAARLKLYNDLRKSGAKVDPQVQATTVAQAATQRIQAAQLYNNQLSEINKKEESDAKEKAKKEKERLDALLTKYSDFEAQREAIKKQGNADIKALEAARTTENTEEIDRAITMATEKIREGIQSVNNLEAAEASKDNDFLKRLFGDYSNMSFDKLQNLITQARQLQGYMSGKNDSKGITFISPDQLKNIEQSPAELDKLKKALDKLLNTNTSSGNNKWENIFKTFEKGLASLKGAEGTEGIAGAIGSIGGAASQAAGELAAMFEEMGDDQTAEAVSGVQQVLGAVANIGQGFAKGGLIGGIGAAVGEAVNFIGQAFAAEARHQKALKEVEKLRLNYQRQYNLLLLEQNLLLKEAESLFGERSAIKAANAIAVYKDALSQLRKELADGAAPEINWLEQITGNISSKYLQELENYKKGYAGLNNIEIVTGHKKTGLFGWGKGKDVYSNVLEVYPQLIKANGDLDTEMLKVILDTQKMSDESKAYIENLLALKDAMNEAEQALEDYLSKTYGSLGQGMMDSVKMALQEDMNALENFAGDAAKVLEELGEQIAYSLFFASEFDDLQKRLKEVYGSGKSEEQIGNDAMNLINQFYDGIGDNVEDAQAWMEAWREKAAAMGFDLWKKDDDKETQTGKAGAFQSLSQEQGTKLEGLFTSVQLHLINIDDDVDNIVDGLGRALDCMQEIKKNTDSLPKIYDEIKEMKTNGIKVK